MTQDWTGDFPASLSRLQVRLSGRETSHVSKRPARNAEEPERYAGSLGLQSRKRAGDETDTRKERWGFGERGTISERDFAHKDWPPVGRDSDHLKFPAMPGSRARGLCVGLDHRPGRDITVGLNLVSGPTARCWPAPLDDAYNRRTYLAWH